MVRVYSDAIEPHIKDKPVLSWKQCDIFKTNYGHVLKNKHSEYYILTRNEFKMFAEIALNL